MPLCHLFFPENDLALASGLQNYTPPPMAVKLRNAGLCLPVWYGNEGDRFITTGMDARWLEAMRSKFDIRLEPYAYNPDNLEPAPWGWSEAVIPWFTARGFARECLPDKEQIALIRRLSHRRICSEIVKDISSGTPMLEAAAEEFTDINQVKDFVERHNNVLLKLPWSSSGRGLIAVDRASIAGKEGQIRGMIARQGSIMAEKKYERTVDFAFLLHLREGRCAFSGLSLFTTHNLGVYAGNILAPQRAIESIIKQHCDAAAFDSLRTTLPEAIEKYIGTAYDGPLGVDAMGVAQTGSIAIAELNLRNTMGHVCLNLYKNHIADGAEGTFTVEPTAARPTNFETAGGRLCAGRLELTPPNPYFTFAATLHNS